MSLAEPKRSRASAKIFAACPASQLGSRLDEERAVVEPAHVEPESEESVRRVEPVRHPRPSVARRAPSLIQSA